MGIDKLRQLTKDELVDLIEEYTKLYITLDGLWFLSVENRYGHDVAAKLDVEVWKSLSQREAKRIRNKRKIAGSGIEAVIEAFKFRPNFLIKEYEVIREGNKAIFRVTKCRSLHAMERDKREVSSCIMVLENTYPEFVRAIDSNVKFRVLKAPPRKSADETCCEFELQST